jgi:uncharacterized protein (DUF2267 family)
MTEIQDFTAAVRLADEWVDDIVRRLGWRDRTRACAALIAALHAVRDCLKRDEAIYLGAALPVLLRGLYYEGWHGGHGAATNRRDLFLARIHDSVHRDPAIDPEHVARATLALLAERLPAAEIEDAKAATPHELRNLWPG